jgi:hypothetical protein
MAFHPFRTFRKYQKPMFATLAIICMFVFVLSIGTGGRGDLFTEIASWAGQGRKVANAVATIDGKQVGRDDLDRLRQQRVMANRFIGVAVPMARQELLTQLETDVGKMQGKNMWAMMAPRIIADLRGEQDPRNPRPQPRLQQLQQAAQMALTLKQFASEGGDEATRKELQHLSDQLEAAAVSALTEAERAQFRQLYFGGTLTDESLLDFMLWLKLADRYQIKFTEKDVKAAVARETLGSLTPARSADIEKGLRAQYKDYSADKLIQAMTDEFRVRAAQAAVLGVPPEDLTAELFSRNRMMRAPGSTSTSVTPAANTPYDDWEFFRDQRTELQVAMLPVPVDRFLAQVKEQPTDEEIRKLFEQHKNDEPDPSLERPGFKQPREVKVQWLSVKPDAPYFRDNATRAAPLARAAAQVGGLLTPPMGGGFAVPALQGAPGLVFDARMLAEYDKAAREWLGRPWDLEPRFGMAYRTPGGSKLAPESVASLVSMQLAAAGTRGLPLSGLLAQEGQAVVRDVRDGLRRLGATILAGTSPTPLAALEPLPLARALTPAAPSLDSLRPQLAQRIADEDVRRFLIDDIEGLRKHLTEVGKPLAAKDAAKDKAAYDKAKEAFDKALQGALVPRQGQAGASTRMNSSFTLKDDPGLKPLVDRYAEQPGVAEYDPLLTGFPYFFFNQRFVDPGAPPPNPAEPQPPANGGPVFTPRWYPGGTPPTPGVAGMLELDQSVYLAWKTADEEARVVPLEAVRPQVVEAWRRQKARGLAEAEAKAVAAAAKGLGTNYPAVKDLAAQHGLPKPFELGPVARWLVDTGAQASPMSRYKQFTLDPKLFPYPLPGGQSNPFTGESPDRQTVEELLKLKDQQPGATEVITDRPKSNYYVAYLVRKDEPTPKEFDNAFFQSARGASGPDMLLNALQTRTSLEYLTELVKQLREDFKLKVNQEALRSSSNSSPYDE